MGGKDRKLVLHHLTTNVLQTRPEKGKLFITCPHHVYKHREDWFELGNLSAKCHCSHPLLLENDV